MKIVSLIENTSGSKDILKEPGLSLYIEYEDKKILFDTGAGKNFLLNAKTLNIDIRDIDYVVISHAHFDHTGGLGEFLSINKKAKVFIKAQALNEYFMKLGILKIYIGLDKTVVDKYSDRICFIDENQELFDNAHLICKIEHKATPIPADNKLTVKCGKNLAADTFEHELMLVLKHNGKLIVLTGCSHNGILNMLSTVSDTFINVPIHAVIGGFHLMGIPIPNWLKISDEQLNELGNKLDDLNIPYIYTCHCTSPKAYNKLKACLGSKLDYLCAGSEISFT